MEAILIKALQLMLSLSILVFVHEMGHFLFARLFKVRVEKFYLFFNPWFTLFKTKPRTPDETEFGIGWLPLGGYCKIAGMIDESMDKEQLAQPEQPWEFRTKPAWQRLLIMVGGVLFNFIAAILIYTMIAFTWGDQYIPLKGATAGMSFSESAQKAGFVDGDILLSADGEELVQFNQSTFRAIVNANEVVVLRKGEETPIAITDQLMKDIMTEQKGFASFRNVTRIDSVLPEREAAMAGILQGDSIVALNGTATPSNEEVGEILRENKNGEVQLTVWRAGDEVTFATAVDSMGTIGIVFSPLPIETREYNLFTAIPRGIEIGVETLAGYVSDMKFVFTKEGAKGVGGFAAIGGLFPEAWNWYAFWQMTALLAIMLAFMNILPIPALDGGHVLFLLYEVVTRRKPSDKFLEYAQTVGMVLLLALLIYANGNDIYKLIFK